MRIVAGTLRGRRLHGPTWDGLRPTSDALRETLFNVLGPSIVALRVLDAFAGTGAVGIEALSRGAAHATFVERDRRAITLLHRNISDLGVAASSTVLAMDVTRPSLDGPFDLVFLDPPYEIAELERILAGVAAVAAPGGRIVLEHARRRESPVEVPRAARYRKLESGDSALSFYTALPAD